MKPILVDVLLLPDLLDMAQFHGAERWPLLLMQHRLVSKVLALDEWMGHLMENPPEVVANTGEFQRALLKHYSDERARGGGFSLPDYLKTALHYHSSQFDALAMSFDARVSDFHEAFLHGPAAQAPERILAMAVWCYPILARMGDIASRVRTIAGVKAGEALDVAVAERIATLRELSGDASDGRGRAGDLLSAALTTVAMAPHQYMPVENASNVPVPGGIHTFGVGDMAITADTLFPSNN